MCAIIGALVLDGEYQTSKSYAVLRHIWEASHARGRDGRGYVLVTEKEIVAAENDVVLHKDVKRVGSARHLVLPKLTPLDGNMRLFIANLRAEPTTEYVAEKRLEDQQPYRSGKWHIVHNGTIANDHELRTVVHTEKVDTKIDSAAIAEVLNDAGERYLGTDDFDPFVYMVQRLKGSFAILAVNESNKNEIFVACNYRPVWYIEVPMVGFFFASARDYFPEGYTPRMVRPYTANVFSLADGKQQVITYPWLGVERNNKALVVCSGGLDSVVAATYTQKVLGMDVTLLHFHYGSRAQAPETQAIEAVAKFLGCELIYQQIGVYREEDSPLLQADSKIAGGEAGAEFAYEWVPARNLLMLSMATALAEARGIETLVLGNNLEEAGAYPDNEPEFIAKFNDLLPFAIGDGKKLQVIMPVGNMMKHEIVLLGVQCGAPLLITWSCYKAKLASDKYDPKRFVYRHCGVCGPCFMRRTAFKINGLNEVIDYEV